MRFDKRWGLGVATVLAALAPACTTRPVIPIIPEGHGTTVQKLHVTRADKVDLLLVVDNSSSMNDKQSELGKRIPELVKAITAQTTASRKASVVDLHVAVVTSSLGSHGTATCAASSSHPHYD